MTSALELLWDELLKETLVHGISARDGENEVPPAASEATGQN